MDKYIVKNASVEFFYERGMRISCVIGGIGFGTIDLYFNDDDRLEIDAENMDKEFVKVVLGNLVDNAKLV